jgi:quercetin dioxygenase-like cupin family protein
MVIATIRHRLSVGAYGLTWRISELMDRREFAALLPALLAGSALIPEVVEAQGTPAGSLPMIESGVFHPSPSKAGAQEGHSSRRYLMGMLEAGDIRLEMHESTIQPGAQHEPVGTHLHSEIWLIREGTAELTTNGVAKKMVPGDIGICVAGDKHFIANTGDTPATYFVVTVGPPE